jgi:hypothetical protein
VTKRICVMSTSQVLAPVHAPLQPVNDWLAPGVAVSVTKVFAEKLPLQVDPVQLSPAGCEFTVPVPTSPTDSA